MLPVDFVGIAFENSYTPRTGIDFSHHVIEEMFFVNLVDELRDFLCGHEAALQGSSVLVVSTAYVRNLWCAPDLVFVLGLIQRRSQNGTNPAQVRFFVSEREKLLFEFSKMPSCPGVDSDGANVTFENC